MKKLFSIADAYAEQSDWTDFALVKFCLGSLGLILGTAVPKKYQKAAQCGAAALFAATYVPLMARFFRVVRQQTRLDGMEGVPGKAETTE